MSKPIRIAGTGCALIDNLYNNIDFSSDRFRRYLSEKPGDGGLTPGKLVFTEEFEQFTNEPFIKSLEKITQGAFPDSFNIGGPGLVSLIHVAQMAYNDPVEVTFTGAYGNDKNGTNLKGLLKELPLDTSSYLLSEKPTPFTDVLSDPKFGDGLGERTFINNIGAAWDLTPDSLPVSFFNADILVFGGTALTPHIHDNLFDLLQKGKSKNAVTIVNTVYDFRNERKNPALKWPLGNTDKTYALIDLLIMDSEEAKRLSGKDAVKDALDYFIKLGVKSFIITDGVNPVTCWSGGSFFPEKGTLTLPISKEITKDIFAYKPVGDTTGCGDNFAGGMIYAVAQQMAYGLTPDLLDATRWGIASGGLACFYLGGTFLEMQKGEKRQQVAHYFDAYKKQG